MALLIVCGLALALIAGLLALPLLRERRRARLARQPFPQAWRTMLRRRVPLVARLPADLQLRLKQLMLIFLAEKPIIGCAGLQVSDEMRVTIAAQACLPLLGDARGFYPRLRQVLLYPGAFVVDRLAQGAGACSARSAACSRASPGARVRSCCPGRTCWKARPIPVTAAMW